MELNLTLSVWYRLNEDITIRCWFCLSFALLLNNSTYSVISPIMKKQANDHEWLIIIMLFYSWFPINVFYEKTFSKSRIEKKTAYLFSLFFVLFLLIIQIHELQFCSTCTNEELARTLESFFLFIGKCESILLYRYVYFFVA